MTKPRTLINARSWPVTAVVRHHYEFSRSPLKRYLLERNRLIFMLTTYERKTLLLLAPLLVAVELGLLLVSLSGGWSRQKVSGWWWIARHGGWMRARRRRLQSQRIVPDRDLAHLWSTRFDPGHEATPAGAGPVGAVVTAYWAPGPAVLVDPRPRADGQSS